MKAKRILAILLTLVMLFSIMPTPAFAAGEISSTTVNSNTADGVSLTKTSVYDPSTGKMEITLEAYTTGTVTPSNRTVPTDIVLVLDVSGSMAGERLTSMTNAVNNFIATTKTQNDSVANDADKHSIAIVKFADDSFYNASNPLAVGNHKNSDNYNYTEVIADFTTVNADGVTSLQTAVNALTSGGATSVDYGLDLAERLFDARTAADDGAYSERNKVVIVFADGEPNHSSGYDSEVAYNAVQHAFTLKSDGVKLFTIGIFEGADHTDTTSDANKFMNYLSSNYPLAYGNTTTETGYWMGLIPYEYTAYHINPGAEPHYNTYYHDADTTSLNSVFQTIASSVGTPQIQLGSSATLVDVVSDYFTISGLGSNPEINVYTASYKGGADFTNAANWNAPVAAPSSVTATLTGDNDTISVSGFDYDSNYISAAARDGGNYGKKLILKVSATPNYAAIDAATAAGTLTSGLIPTNDTAALLDSTATNVAWASAPTLQANTVTYKISERGTERTVGSYYRFPGSEVSLNAKPADTAEYTYGDWTTSDASISGGAFTMPSGNVVLTSTATVNDYDVTFEYHGNVPAGATTLPAAMTNIAVGTSVTLPTVTAPAGYVFSGWVEDANDIAAGTTTFNMPAEDLHFEGYFTAQPNTYTVEHYLMNTDGSWPTTATNTVTNASVTDATVTAQLTNHTGFTYDETKTTASGSQTSGVSFVTVDGQQIPQSTVAADSSTVLKLYYKRNVYQVSYKYVGSVPADAVPSTAGLSAYTHTYRYGEEVTIAADATAPGYTFSGWSINTGATSITGGKMKMPDSDVVLHGSFTASNGIPYTVKHYFEKLNSNNPANKDNYTVDETLTKILYGTTNTTVSAVPLSDLIGFKYESGMSTASGTVAGNGTLVLELYYSRTRHTVEYQYRSTVPAGASPSTAGLSAYTETYKYGDTVIVKPNATATGYVFSGWSTTDTTVSGNEFKMPASDVDFYGQFSPAANSYVVEHYMMDTNGNYPSTTDHKHTYDDVHTGDTVTATISEHTGFTYDEAKTTEAGSQPAGVSFASDGNGNLVPQATVAADGSTVLKLYFKRNQFNVTYKFDGVVPAGVTLPVDDNDYYYGQTVTLAAKPSAAGYTFHGWSLYTGSTAIEGNTMTMPNSNVTLYGSFVANSDTKYTVKHYFEKLNSDDPTNKNNYELDVNLTEVLSGTTGDTVTAEPYSGIVGVKYESTLSKNSGKITVDASGNGTLVLELYYSRTRHKVTYQYLNTVPGASTLPTEVSYMYGATVTVAGAASAPGYNFSGWSTTDAAVSGNQFTMPADDVVISGSFSPKDNTYTVEIYEEKIGGGWADTTDHKHVYEGVKTGDTVTATLPTIEGFTYDAAKTAGSQNPGVSIVEVNGKNVPQATVAPEGGTILKLYFSRNKYTITYVYDGAVPSDVNPVYTVTNEVQLVTDYTITEVYYQQEVEIKADATASGYTFSGWTINTGDTAIVEGKMVMPDHDVVLHGSFTANGDTKYMVEHYFETTTAGSYAIDNSKTQNLKGKTDTKVTAMPLSGSDIAGFTFDAAKSASTRTGTIAGDGSLVLELYYTRTRHTVTYQYTGYVPGDATKLPAQATVMYGTELQRAADATAPGYDFSGWTASSSVTVDADGKFTMPAANVTFTGHFIPRRNTYRVEHYLMGTDGKYPGSASHFFDVTDAVTGQQVSADTNVLHTGFAFDSTTTGEQYKGIVAADGSTVLKLYFKRNQFTVTYMYDGTVPQGASPTAAGLSAYTGTYYYQQSVTLQPHATAPGYNFTGWSIHTGDTSIIDGKMIMPNSNVIIYGAFNASHNTPYIVNHYFENVDSADHDNAANYTLDPGKTQHFSGTTNSDVTAEPLSGTNILGFDYFPTLSKNSGKITVDANGNGTLVLNLYYKRMDTVIKYQFTGTVPADADFPASVNTTFGAIVDVAGIDYVDGYTFHGWFNELGITAGAGESFTVPAVPEIIFSGRYTADPNKYRVEHYMMGLDGNYPADASHSYEVTNVVTGQRVEASTAVTHTGFTFDATTTGDLYKGTVAADGGTVLKLYFARNKYTVTYQYDNDPVPAHATALPSAKEYFYGQEVTIAKNATAPSYIFTGWGIHTGDTTIVGGKMKMPSSDVIIHGAFNPDPNTKYIVEHYFEVLDNTPDSIDFSDTPDKTTIGTGKTGSQVIAMPLSGPEVLGFTFDSSLPGTEQTGTIAADSNADGYGDLVLKLYYKRMESQVIYEYTDTVPYGADTVPDPESHKYGTEVTVAGNPTPIEGYTFSGWEPWDTTVVSVTNGKFIMPERTVYFHGSFSANPSGYTVNHFLMAADGTYSATPTTSEYFSVGVSVGDTAKAVPITTFRTYTYDAVKTTEFNSSMVMDNGLNVPTGIVDADGTLVLNLYYSRNTYDLSYEFTGVVPEGAVKPEGREDIMHGSSVTLDSATVPAGYEFDGWYLGDTKVGSTLTMPAADTVVTGSFTPASNVKYTVEYYLQDLDGSSYTKSDLSYEATGTTGAYVVGNRVDFTGFTFNLEKSTWNGHIKGDGSLVLKLYYDRNVHTVTYYYYGELPTDAVITPEPDANTHQVGITETYKYGETFTVNDILTINDPTYSFRGWFTPSISGINSTAENAAGTVLTMPDHDIVFYGSLYNYVVFYDLNGGKLNDDDTVPSKTVGWDYDDLLPAGTPKKSNESFTGWSYEGTNVTADMKYSDLAANTSVLSIILTAQYEPSGGGGGGGGGGTTPTTGTAKLVKVDANDSSTVLPDVIFELHKQNGTLVGTYTTNAKGEIIVSSLDAGDYYWLEVLPAEGYSLDSTHRSFTVSANETTSITVTNSRTPVPEVFTGDHYGYIIGYQDGKVHPERNITRAEVATIFFRLLDDDIRDANSTRENNFSDVNGHNWFNHAVSTMSAMGIINGYEDGTFRPNAPITRAEFAAIASRFDLDGDASDTIFKDIYEHWGRREINIAANNGWVLGYEDGTFKPDSLVTRAEAMAMVNRVLQRIPESSADLLPGMIVWPDNQDTRKWYYMAVQEATNSHHYDRKDSGYEKWTELREVRNWDELEK